MAGDVETEKNVTPTSNSKGFLKKLQTSGYNIGYSNLLKNSERGSIKELGGLEVSVSNKIRH